MCAGDGGNPRIGANLRILKRCESAWHTPTGGAGSGIKAVGAAGPGVGEDGVQAVIIVQALKEQVPEGDQGG